MKDVRVGDEQYIGQKIHRWDGEKSQKEKVSHRNFHCKIKTLEGRTIPYHSDDHKRQKFYFSIALQRLNNCYLLILIVICKKSQVIVYLVQVIYICNTMQHFTYVHVGLSQRMQYVASHFWFAGRLPARFLRNRRRSVSIVQFNANKILFE